MASLHSACTHTIHDGEERYLNCIKHGIFTLNWSLVNLREGANVQHLMVYIPTGKLEEMISVCVVTLIVTFFAAWYVIRIFLSVELKQN